MKKRGGHGETERVDTRSPSRPTTPIDRQPPPPSPEDGATHRAARGRRGVRFVGAASCGPKGTDPVAAPSRKKNRLGPKPRGSFSLHKAVGYVFNTEINCQNNATTIRPHPIPFGLSKRLVPTQAKAHAVLMKLTDSHEIP